MGFAPRESAMLSFKDPPSVNLPERGIHRLAVTAACTFYLIGFYGYSLGHDPPTAVARYIIYMASVTLLIPLLFVRVARVHPTAIAYLVLYVLAVVFAQLASPNDSSIYFWREVLITAAIIVCFVPWLYVEYGHLRTLLVASFMIFLVMFAVSGNHDLRLLNILENESGSALEEGFDNHQGGLVGPIYAVFFYAIGAKSAFLLSLLMSLLGGKRIAIIAIMMGIATAWASLRFRALEMRSLRFVAVLALLLTLNLAGTYMFTISEELYQSFRPGAHIEQIMLGRYAITRELSRMMEERSITETMFGSGAGSASALTELVSDGALSNPHNDWLKLAYDYGLIGSLAISAFMAAIYSSSRTGIVLAATTGTMMTTDNVTIYLYYQFPIALMLAYCSAHKERIEESLVGGSLSEQPRAGECSIRARNSNEPSADNGGAKAATSGSPVVEVNSRSAIELLPAAPRLGSDAAQGMLRPRVGDN
jgi:hypothetical protein